MGEAARIGVRHGARMMTIHTSGGEEMMARAAATAAEEADKAGRAKPLLLGVTILTSLKNEDLALDRDGRRHGGPGPAAGRPGQSAGMDGVVCSAQEIEIVRKEVGPDFLIVTPGIRPAWAAAQDQKRIMTPAEAVAKGSDYLVVGRPITQAASPPKRSQKIVAGTRSRLKTGADPRRRSRRRSGRQRPSRTIDDDDADDEVADDLVLGRVHHRRGEPEVQDVEAVKAGQHGQDAQGRE